MWWQSRGTTDLWCKIVVFLTPKSLNTEAKNQSCFLFHWRPPPSTDMSHIGRRSCKVSLSGSSVCINDFHSFTPQLKLHDQEGSKTCDMNMISWVITLVGKETDSQNLGYYETYPGNETSLQYKCSAAQSGEIVAKIPASLGLFSPFWTSTAASAGKGMTVFTKQPTLRAGAAGTLHLHAASAVSSPLRAGWLQGKPHSHLCSAAKIHGIIQGSKTITAKLYAFTGQSSVVQPQKI